MLLASLVFAQAPFEEIPGRWYPDPLHRGEVVSQLESLGYVGAYEPAPVASGVVRWDRAKALPGSSLYNSGHAATALLVAMDGRVQHTWAMPFTQAFPSLRSGDAQATGAWRRVALRPADGHLLGIYEGLGLVHLDRRSRIVWASANRAHHDARWRPDGGVLVLTRNVHPGKGPGGRPLLEDCVSELDASGREVRRVSVLEALGRSRWARLLELAPRDTGDLLHTNALFPLDEVRGGHGGPGRVLLSLRHVDALAVLDLATAELLWVERGPWSRQHDAEISPSGKLWLFDNRGGPRGLSRVLALEPWTMRLLWSWAGSPDRPLVSEVLGAVQELPNGNVLVTESTRGRAVEVTPTGEAAWEYRNPARAGPDDAYIAAIFEMVRYPASALRGWLGG